jgi:mannose-1-phosphate guanylyltransferase
MEEDPEATVLIVPSDHFIQDTERFVHHIRFASLLVDQFTDHLVVLGAAPDGPDPDYGWIVPGQHRSPWVSHHFVPDPREVASFHEKPNQRDAEHLYHRGALWNTLIAVVRVRTLWRLGWQHLPDMMRRFETLRQVIRAVQQGRAPDEHRAKAVEHTYAHLATADFSHDLLERCAGSLLVLPMEGVGWSDWGKPERVTSTLARIGKRPTFPITAAAGHDHGSPRGLPRARRAVAP